MSDFQKALGKVNSPAKIKAMENREGAEKIRDAIKAGGGDVVKGSRKLGLEKPGLKAQLKKQQMKCGRGK